MLTRIHSPLRTLKNFHAVKTAPRFHFSRPRDTQPKPPDYSNSGYFITHHKLSGRIKSPIPKFNDPLPDGKTPPRHFAVFALKDGARLTDRQFLVSEGDRVMAERLYSDRGRLYDVGDRVVWREVLLFASRDKTAVGQPVLPGARVEAVVEEQTTLKDIMVFKKKRRKGYKRLQIFSPCVTVLRVTSLSMEGF